MYYLHVDDIMLLTATLRIRFIKYIDHIVLMGIKSIYTYRILHNWSSNINFQSDFRECYYASLCQALKLFSNIKVYIKLTTSIRFILSLDF